MEQDQHVRQQLLDSLEHEQWQVRLAASNALVHAEALPTLVEDWWDRLGAWLRRARIGN